MSYDAEIRIKTKIDNSEFVKGAEKIESKIEEIKETAEEIRVVDFDWSKQAKDMAAVSKKIEDIERSLDKTSSGAEKNEEHFNNLKIDVEEYSKTLKELGSQGKFFGDADYDRVYLAWQNAKTAVKEYEAELYKQTASGKAQEAEKVTKAKEKEVLLQQKIKAQETQEAEKVARAKEKEFVQQQKIEEQAERNLQKENSKLERAIKVEAAIQEQAAAEYRIGQIKNTATVNDQKIVDLLERRKQLMEELKMLEKAGVGAGYKEWESKKAEILEIDAAVKKYSKTLFGTRGEQKKVSEGLRKLGQAGKKMFTGLTNGAKKSNSSLGVFASRLKGIALSLLVFNWITKGFNAMVTGMKEGFKNLAKHSESYRQALSDLMGANIQMKNSFAAAFAPIVQLIIPHLITLVNYVTLASNKIAQFIAVMNGQTTWIKATEVQGDYAGSLEGTAAAAKKAAGALAKFDDLDVLNKSDANQSGGGGSKPEGGFEEVPLPDNGITNLAKRLKELIGAEDWYGVGALLGEKLNDALGSINWESIKQKAFELGKNIAKFLNGGIETTNWHLVGSTIAEGLNTAINFVYGFVSTFSWSGLGLAIAQSINGFFDTFDPVKAGITLTKLVVGLLTTLITAIQETDWETVGEKIAELLNKIEWDTILKKVGETIASVLVAVIDFAKGFDDKSEGVTEWIGAVGKLALGILVLKGVLGGIEIIGKGFAVIKSFLSFVGGAYAFFSTGITGFAGLATAISNLSIAMNPAMLPALIDMLKIKFPGFGNWVDDINDWLVTNIQDPIFKFFKDIFNFEWSFGDDGFFAKAGECFSKVMAAFESKDWIAVGVNILEGILNGFGGAIGLIAELVVNFFMGFYRAICGVFGIHSPAKEMEPLGINIFLGIMEGFRSMFSTTGQAIAEWFQTYVSPWFTAEKWQELGQGILQGISTKWGEFCTWWSETALVKWWEEYVAPWFTAEKWQELGQGILDGISEKWGELSSWWDTTINDWFTNNVAVWFTAEKWKQLGENMKKGIFNGFKGILNNLEGLLNSMITGFENMCNKIITAINEIISEWNSSAGLIKSFRIDTFAPLSMGRIKFDIPALANGAVLRGGDPFMAILGDQPRGQTNVETPVYVIEDAVSKAMGRYSGSGSMTINLNYDGETFARLSLKDMLSEMDRQGYDVDVLRGIT